MENENIIQFMESKGWEGDIDSMIFFKSKKWYGFDCSNGITLFDCKKGMTFKTCEDFKECQDLL